MNNHKMLDFLLLFKNYMSIEEYKESLHVLQQRIPKLLLLIDEEYKEEMMPVKNTL